MARRIVATIPARAGSVGIPNKNLQKIGNHSLIELTARFALEIDEIDEVIVTTDIPLEKLGDVAKLDVTIVERPEELATSTTPMTEVITHLLTEGYLKQEDVLVQLQPTTPFRSIKELSKAIKHHLETSEPVVSCARHSGLFFKSNGESLLGEIKPEKTNRQASDIVAPTGSFWIIPLNNWLEKPAFYPAGFKPWLTNKLEELDINDELDLFIARLLQSSFDEIMEAVEEVGGND